MSLRDQNFKVAYDSDRDNLLEDFYIPALSSSVKYYRTTYSFSSSSLAKAAMGMARFIENGGIMRLITDVEINADDFRAIKESMRKPEKIATEIMLQKLSNLDELEEYFKKGAKALSWMLANNYLEIKVVIIPKQENRQNLSHMKIGILEDSEGNVVSFSGSANETASGWGHNIEEFKVFKSWDKGVREYVAEDKEKFERFWNGEIKKGYVINMPEAVKSRLLKIKYRSKSEVVNALRAIEREKSCKEQDQEEWLSSGDHDRVISLRDFQKNARQSWIDNSYRGILEMATGTGKTFTAIACINSLWKSVCCPVVIAAPYNHLVSQWEKEIKKLSKEGTANDFGELINTYKRNILIASSSRYNWKKELANAVLEHNNKNLKRLIILTTHDTASSDAFIKQVEKIKEDPMLIVDEVHSVGSSQRVNSLLEKYKFRLALSATPRRWMDEIGSNNIFAYFGKTVFEFPLSKAINTINPLTGKTYLTPYHYYPIFVDLDADEADEYLKLTKEISKISNYKEKDKSLQHRYDILCIKRANIVKSARNKLTLLTGILKEVRRQNPELDHTLIYCHPGEQFNTTLGILNNERIPNHQFTSSEGVRKTDSYKGLSEREYILKNFESGHFKILVAMRCLDEGVDIPAAQYAILLASSTNPKEYIQRRGRLLRRHGDKKLA